VWIVRSSCCNWAWSCGLVCCDVMTRYEQIHDSIIQGNTYHRIYASSSWSCNPPCSSPCTSLPMGGYYIREDSAKRIWMYDISSMSDTLLYDFNLSIGDTINTILVTPGDIFVVQALDSIFIGSNYRNIYYYSSTYGSDTCTHFLIEGIGSGAGLFSELCGSCFEHGYRLLCYKQDNQTLYYPSNAFCSTDTSIDCNFTVSISESIRESKSVILFPNPATNELRIQSRILGTELRIERIEIYDVMGKKRLTPALSKGEGAASIDVSTLTPGMYFVRVKIEKGIVTEKFIKQ
jgi:hypothetical protein